jgi:hypothetical protein
MWAYLEIAGLTILIKTVSSVERQNSTLRQSYGADNLSDMFAPRALALCVLRITIHISLFSYNGATPSLVSTSSLYSLVLSITAAALGFYFEWHTVACKTSFLNIIVEVNLTA